MKLLSYMLFFVMCLMFAVEGQASVDPDSDEFTCELEDDGLYCNENGQDLFPFIPNLYIGDGVEVLDVWPIGNPDGYLTLEDVTVGIGNLSYLDSCLYRERWITRNAELLAARLQPLNYTDLTFIVQPVAGCSVFDSLYPVPLF